MRALLHDRIRHGCFRATLARYRNSSPGVASPDPVSQRNLPALPPRGFRHRISPVSTLNILNEMQVLVGQAEACPTKNKNQKSQISNAFQI